MTESSPGPSPLARLAVIADQHRYANHQTSIAMVVMCECCELPNEFIFKTKHDG
jgi:hypothetical protein